MDAFIALRKRKREHTPENNAKKCTVLSDIIGEDGKIDKDFYDAVKPCETDESYPALTRQNPVAISA